jgi:predicted acetyltransferase
MIRYLKQNEKPNTRKLYEQAFPEDEKPFVDFYYESVMERNLVIADVEDEKIISMAHLNPYDVMLRGKRYRLDYIVAVATDETARRQGRMRKIMTQLLNDLKLSRCPFTFLEPANPLYYAPFDFTYVSDREKRIIRPDIRSRIGTGPYGGENADEVITFTNAWLREHAEIFCERNAGYLERLGRELAACGGRLSVLTDEAGKVCGTEAFDYADTEEADCRMICSDDLTERKGKPEPFMMARIVDLQEFLKVIPLKKECAKKEETFTVRITDPVIKENSGIFLWKADHDSSKLIRADETKAKVSAEFSVAELTAWLFGYAACAKASWCNDIRTIRSVYFDEGI